MNRILTILLAGVLAGTIGLSSASAQSGVLDQAETHDNVAWNMTFYFDMQQDIRVGVDGTLEGFMIRMASLNMLAGHPVSIFLGPGPHLSSETPAWSGTAFATQAGNWEWVFVDCSSAGINLNVNDVYTIRVGDGIAPTGATDLTGNSGWPTAFYPEPFYETLQYRTTDRLTFETYMLPPLPILSVTGTCGGSMTFDVANGSGSFYLVYGNAGSTVIHGITLDIANPTLATTMSSSLTAVIPVAGCGKTVQVVDTATFGVSNPVVL